ncbi:MAG: HAD family phosphatase [Desulfobacterales bacterium]
MIHEMAAPPAEIPVAAGMKGLIFDCDGTLADTMPIHIAAWCDSFAVRGISCPEGFIHTVTGRPAEKIVAIFNRRYHHHIDAAAFAVEKNHRARLRLPEAVPIAPVVEIVRRYRGILPMAVASGGTRDNVMLTLEVIGLADFFEAVITADDPVHPKPDPGIFLEAARRLRVEPSLCQVFEDGDAGLEAARRAGMVATDIRPFVGPAGRGN